MEICPDCQITLPPVDGERHPYLGASPSCWALYGELLAREYGDPAYMAVHRMTVDAYCAQHPGKPERRSIQSINVHLVGLYLTVERKLAGDFARSIIGRMTVEQADKFEWFYPPARLGDVCVGDVIAAKSANSHRALVTRWAESVWQAWSPCHRHIRDLAETVTGTER